LKFRRRQLGQFIDNLGYTHVFNLVCNGKNATANSIRQWKLRRQFPHPGADFVRRFHGFDGDDVRSL
jgi:hypothetical protein